MNFELEKICDRIYSEIVLLMGEEIGIENGNLFNGKWGGLLYMFYYEKYCNNNQYNALCCLEKLYEELDTSTSNFSLCTGLSGPYWLLNHLNKNGFIDIDINELIIDFVPLAIERSEIYLKHNNFDFLHGSSGVCKMLIDYGERQDVKNHLSHFVKKLYEASRMTDSGLSIPLFHYQTEPPSEKGIDAFSLAHGTCSYQVILLGIYQLSIEQDLCRWMIDESMRLILNSENLNLTINGSLFPAYLDGSKWGSRVSWCYGDLNIGSSLWQCGKFFNNNDWCNKAIEIYNHNTKRDTCELAGIVDVCVCHGTAGNALMFLRMWEETGLEQFKDAASKWYDLTYKMIEFSENEFGIRSWQGDENGWKYKWQLLEGSSGTGLCLISDYLDKALPWDSLLLLS